MRNTGDFTHHRQMQSINLVPRAFLHRGKGRLEKTLASANQVILFSFGLAPAAGMNNLTTRLPNNL